MRLEGELSEKHQKDEKMEENIVFLMMHWYSVKFLDLFERQLVLGLIH
jgi:hypothetical protein